MIVDPRWYECFVSALTGLTTSSAQEPAAVVAERAESLADAAYERLLAKEARLAAAQKPKEIKKGQVWRFKQHGRILVVAGMTGEHVLWRQTEHGSDSAIPAKRVLESKDSYLIGQEPDVAPASEAAPHGQSS
ncbi:hypothetical protein [Polyangium sp. 15x6]|uniref:hypothetical protein n=1 Tax=Polyangium sp. 15x6 TaxID=3042687 RepID=UPI00249CA536|nr:hypothetical protein [Polyangium sp. 15x6]MDI3282086.1 hypothetical protein [Polyangium sp. 15x6]